MSTRLMRIVETLVYFNIGVCLSTLFPTPRWWALASGSLAIVLAAALVAVTRRAPRANFLKNLHEAAQKTPRNQYLDPWDDAVWHQCAREGCPMYTRNELCVQCLRDGWTHCG